MKSVNIVKRLEKQGYEITYKKWSYWDGVPHVELDGFSFAIAEIEGEEWISLNLDFIYNHVEDALYIAKRNNPIFIKKIEESPAQSWYYSRWLILSMQDYYEFKKQIYPYDEYYSILQKLKKEYK